MACECSTDVEENLGNSLLPNLLVAILKAMALRVVGAAAVVRSCGRVGGESETCKSKVELKPQFTFTVFQLWLFLLEKINISIADAKN